MIIEKDQHIICCLKNNAVLEGTIESWLDNEVVLLSLDGQSRLIIQHPTQDIVFVKVILNSVALAPLSEVKQQVYNQLQEVLQEPDEDLRRHNIHHLKYLLNEQERKVIKEKIKEHHLGDVRMIKYGTPGFFKKSGSQ